MLAAAAAAAGAAALVFGKQTGIFGTVWTLVRLRIAPLPPGATWVQLYGVSLMCGIGFTMSLFIAALAFPAGSLQNDVAKRDIFAGSLVAAGAE